MQFEYSAIIVYKKEALATFSYGVPFSTLPICGQSRYKYLPVTISLKGIRYILLNQSFSTFLKL